MLAQLIVGLSFTWLVIMSVLSFLSTGDLPKKKQVPLVTSLPLDRSRSQPGHLVARSQPGHFLHPHQPILEDIPLPVRVVEDHHLPARQARVVEGIR